MRCTCEGCKMLRDVRLVLRVPEGGSIIAHARRVMNLLESVRREAYSNGESIRKLECRKFEPTERVSKLLRAEGL